MQTTPQITPEDEMVRGALTRLIATLGHAPSSVTLAAETGFAVAEIDRHLQNLADAHALLLHPGTVRPWVVHPFALGAGSCWVKTPGQGYWANCLYCGLGIAAALDSDAAIITRYGGEAETVCYKIKGGKVSPSDDLFHLSVPPRRWWDNVIFACSSFQPFRSEAAINDWCQRHDLAKGAVMTIPQLTGFARDWYGDYLKKPWRKRSIAEVQDIFRRHNLTGPFWEMGAT